MFSFCTKYFYSQWIICFVCKFYCMYHTLEVANFQHLCLVFLCSVRLFNLRFDRNFIQVFICWYSRCSINSKPENSVYRICPSCLTYWTQLVNNIVCCYESVISVASILLGRMKLGIKPANPIISFHIGNLNFQQEFRVGILHIKRKPVWY